MNSSNLDQPVQYLKSVGPKRAESFSKIGINKVRDLLFYFPTRYLDRTTILNTVKVIQYLQNGYEGEVTVIGKVEEKEVIRYGKKSLFKVLLKDSAGRFECVWFQGIKFFKDKFNEGEYYAISAKPVITKFGHLQFTHPDFDRLEDEESSDFLNTGKIIPFYRLSKELKSGYIGDLSLRKIIHNAVENYSGNIEETLPDKIVERQELSGLADSVMNIHFPQNREKLEAAQQRFKFEELFFLELLVALRKNINKQKLTGIPLSIKTDLVKKFLKELPFELTDSQLEVLREIRIDLEDTKPMNRLLQGDVGSGKTIVALIAMLIAVDSGYQAAIMAPTEILANQHYINMKEILKYFDININLLIGGQKKSERKKELEEIQSQGKSIIIGTHALLEDNVLFNKLGLVIIDEQHRFGVVQRSRLIRKGIMPNVLVMTATPIPRTLSLTLYGDLDVSSINEMPKDRVPVKTFVRGEKALQQIYQFIKEKIVDGYQTFMVYPLVEESDKLELKAAETHFEKLKSTFFSDVNVGMIHGKMNWREKEMVMKDFAAKKYDLLISTTVIEVGIDVPEANIMIINDAFRFGLSQLHQLRGRVGRGNKQAYCILVTNNNSVINPDNVNLNFEYMSKSEIEKNKSKIRLNAMVKYTDGFKLSEIDLKLRGPGDIFGTKQSGLPELKYADLVTDFDIIVKAKEEAFKIIEEDPKLNKPEHQKLKKILLTLYKENLNYSKIA